MITFSSVNDRIETTGLSTYNFIQPSAPGSGYAFPSIKDGVVGLNRTLMRDIGVQYGNVQFYNLANLGCIKIIGHPVLQGNTPFLRPDGRYETKVYAPRRLFFAGDNNNSTTGVTNNAGVLPGINDTLNTNSHPETTFVNCVNATMSGYLNYAE